jgi:hypothetical protein
MPKRAKTKKGTKMRGTKKKGTKKKTTKKTKRKAKTGKKTKRKAKTGKRARPKPTSIPSGTPGGQAVGDLDEAISEMKRPKTSAGGDGNWAVEAKKVDHGTRISFGPKARQQCARAIIGLLQDRRKLIDAVIANRESDAYTAMLNSTAKMAAITEAAYDSLELLLEPFNEMLPEFMEVRLAPDSMGVEAAAFATEWQAE